MSDQYIVIPNWERFQHYKGQDRPAWIKFYTHVLHDSEFLKLTMGARLTLFGLWLVYAESGRRLALDTASLSRQLGHRVTRQTLESLNHAGFIEFSSRDGLETLYTQKRREEERREEPLTPRSGESGNPLLEIVGNGTPRQLRSNPRALGTNPRAVAKRKRVERHREMLDAARAELRSWNGPTDVAHERLDEFEKQHGSSFTDQERDALIDEMVMRAYA